MALNPPLLMQQAGLEPDPWQATLLRTRPRRALLLCSRQAGKSTTTAALALHEVLFHKEALVLLLSPSLRQSQELFGKVLSFYRALGEPVAAQSVSALRITLANGSRIMALPGTEKTVRGYSGVSLLVIDEASRVLDELYYSVRPMLAVSNGRLIALTTPFGKRGFFFEEWENGGDDWHRVRVTAYEVPRISRAFLEEERQKMGTWWFEQEYLCHFSDTVDSVFRQEDIDTAFSEDVTPLVIPSS